VEAPVSRPRRKAAELEHLGGRELAQGNHLVAADFFLAAGIRYRRGNLEAAERCARQAAAALDRYADELCQQADAERRRRRAS
jgi:glutathione S-transferase